GEGVDPEAGQRKGGELAPGEQADRGDAEVLEDLRPEADLAPLARTRLFRAGDAGLRDRMRRHADGAVAQEDDDAATILLEPLQRGVHRIGAAEHVAADVSGVPPRPHRLARPVPAVYD